MLTAWKFPLHANIHNDSHDMQHTDANVVVQPLYQKRAAPVQDYVCIFCFYLKQS